LLEALWSIDGPANDLMYLVAGTRRAMLVDTGMGIGNLAQTVRGLTSLPLTVVNTHGHPDHAGGNGGFEEIWLAPQDEALMRQMTADQFRQNDLKRAHGGNDPEYRHLAESLVPVCPYRLQALQPGQIFDLGGRCFEVLTLPGHTPGSICLLNPDEKLLFTGDAIVATPVWMYLQHSTSLSIYLDSLKRLQARQAEFDVLLPGHQPTPLGKDQLDALIACAQEILEGRGVGEPNRTFAGAGLQWSHGPGIIIYDPDRLH
jgi:glyoxylase-like metal-dependent hydrolase (beta-lactamase superfamily II)